MVRHLGRWVGVAPLIALCPLIGCQSIVGRAPVAAGNISASPAGEGALTTYTLTGDTHPLHDPSIMRQGGTYYVFTSDVIGLPAGNYLPIRCSQDELNWVSCGSVFTQIPAWVVRKVPGAIALWAPDISYFNGLYHLYYAGSTTGSQRSVIGLATNATLDANDPQYKWIDAGEVLESAPGDDFNAIDPNIVNDEAGSIWMNFGSYWSGIKQTQIDPQTGRPLANASRVSLATRPGVVNNPIEGASMVHHGNFFYLLLSVDYCCNPDLATDNYKEIVGRSASPQGPFVDMNGTAMMNGGGSILLQAQGVWIAPGGGTAYVDGESGESLLVFHALKMTENGAPYLWLKHITWQNDWPVLN
jgi:arabinan endo-1,5-alpha-L-arabinosidase